MPVKPLKPQPLARRLVTLPDFFSGKAAYPVMCEFCQVQSFVEVAPGPDDRVLCQACALRPNLLKPPR